MLGRSQSSLKLRPILGATRRHAAGSGSSISPLIKLDLPVTHYILQLVGFTFLSVSANACQLSLRLKRREEAKLGPTGGGGFRARIWLSVDAGARDHPLVLDDFMTERQANRFGQGPWVYARKPEEWQDAA